jgi:hypothetical protein
MMDFLTNTNFLDQMLLLASAGADPVKHVRGISGFLGGFYVLMAVLNAGAAIYWWQYGLPGAKPATGEGTAPAITETGHGEELSGHAHGDMKLGIIWGLVAFVFGGIFAPLAMSGSINLVPGLPQWFQNLVDSLSGPRGLHARHDVAVGRVLCVSPLLYSADRRLGLAEYHALALGARAQGSGLCLDRGQAGQRADRGASVLAGVLYLAGDLSRGAKR